MRVSQIISLVALPFAFGLPATTLHDVGHTMAHFDQRAELSQYNFAPFNLTNIGMECARNITKEMYACELRFDWYDPNSVPENDINSCTCAYHWSWDGETAQAGEKNTYDNDSYSLCLDQMPVVFQMKISTFNTSQAFELEIAHRYHDSENFSAPWDYPMTFAKPAVHLPLIEHEDNRFRLYDAGPIYAKIQGFTA